MLLKAWDGEQESVRQLFGSTLAVLFLGTPHQGSKYSSPGEVIRRLVSAVGFDAASQNIRTLEIDSPILEDCDQRFQKIHKRGGFRVFTFQEAHGMKGTQILNLNQKVCEAFRQRPHSINLCIYRS
jgi:ankyrin repeat domain-containing protein 50